MAKPTEAQKKFAKIFKQIGKDLLALNVPASSVISRADNNQCFEIGWYLQEIAERIKKGYPDTNYKVIEKVRPRDCKTDLQRILEFFISFGIKFDRIDHINTGRIVLRMMDHDGSCGAYYKSFHFNARTEKLLDHYVVEKT